MRTGAIFAVREFFSLPFYNAEMETVKLGGCLCGGVRFELYGELRPAIACHCTQCRKSGGHYTAATAVRPQNFRLLKAGSLRWFRASQTARRGFCGDCGSSLFFRPDSGDRIAVFVGALDGETGLKLVAHIFVSDKGDYYEINETDDVAMHPAGGAGVATP